MAELDDAALTALLEDPAFADEVRNERARRVKAAPAPAATAATAPPAKFRAADWSHLFEFVDASRGGPAISQVEDWDGFVKACGTVRVPVVWFDALVKWIAAGIERRQALEARVEALEARGPGLKYRGVHDVTELYQPGDVVTHQGSMWVCREAVNGGPPGDGAPAWQLAVKHGRDGRDGRPIR